MTPAEGGDRPEREAEACDHNAWVEDTAGQPGRCVDCGQYVGHDRPANPQPLGGEYEQVRTLIENAWLEHDGPQSVRDPGEVAAEHIVAHYADLEERLSVMRRALERIATTFAPAAARQIAAQALVSVKQERAK